MRLRQSSWQIKKSHVHRHPRASWLGTHSSSSSLYRRPDGHWILLITMIPMMDWQTARVWWQTVFALRRRNRTGGVGVDTSFTHRSVLKAIILSDMLWSILKVHCTRLCKAIATRATTYSKVCPAGVFSTCKIECHIKDYGRCKHMVHSLHIRSHPSPFVVVRPLRCGAIMTMLATLDFNLTKDADGNDIAFKATFVNGVMQYVQIVFVIGFWCIF